MRALRAAVLVVLLALVGVACRDLDFLTPGECGNGVLEPSYGEDCDSFAAEQGTHCIPAGQAHACRYGCGSADAVEPLPCPRGWGCGIDGICRQASGQLDAPVALGEPPGTLMQLEDADGDALDDVVTLDPHGIGVRYLAASGRPQDVATRVGLPAPGARFALGLLDVDPIVDYVVPVSDGLAVMRGSADRRLLPTLQLTDSGTAAPTHVAALHALPGVPGQQLLALIGAQILIFVGEPASVVAAPNEAEALAPPLAVAQLDEASEVEELVLAYGGEPSVHVYRPSGGALGVGLDALAGVSLGGDQLTGGVFARQLNPQLDSHLDLVIGGSLGMYVAYGTGAGTFHSSTPLPPAGSEDHGAALWFACEFPLAVDDLDGDQTVDWVTPNGLFLSSQASDCSGAPSIWSVENPWARAAVADVNGDGAVDLAVAANAPDVLVYRAAPGGLFNPLSIPTTGTVRLLETGDFDGDFHADLAIVEQAGAANALGIAFGAPSGGALPPTRIGTVQAITALVGARLNPTSEAWIDGISDLVVTAESSAGQGGFAVIVGRSDRFPLATFSLVAGDKAQLPGDATTARAGDAVHVVALATDYRVATDSSQLFALGVSPEAQLTPGDIAPLPMQHGTPVLIAAADVDADGDDEIAVLGDTGNSATIVLRTVRVSGDGTPGFAPPSAAVVLPGVKAVPSMFSSVVFAAWLQPALDACALVDGEPPSLVLLVEVPGENPDIGPAHMRLAVVYNQELRAALGGTEVEAPPAQPFVPDDEDVHGFACANMDGDEALELVFGTVNADVQLGYPARVRLYVSELEASARTLTQPQLVSELDVGGPAPVGTLDPGANIWLPMRGMRAGDTNGDGVHDIALALDGDILLLAGKPVHP